MINKKQEDTQISIFTSRIGAILCNALYTVSVIMIPASLYQSFTTPF